MSEPINVLWTGGWDSTYRVLELVIVEQARVRPYHLLDGERRSTLQELRAMARIKQGLAEDFGEAGSRLLPTVFRAYEDLPNDPLPAERLQRLKNRATLGRQYEYLARLANQEGLERLELTIHRDDRAFQFLTDDLEEAGGGVYRLCDEPSNPDLELFRGFRFSLANQTKLGMQAEAERHGFGHLLERTWFCHLPVPYLDWPCGWCSPCRDAVAEGLGRRVPRSTRLAARVVPIRAMKWMKKRVTPQRGQAT